MNSINMWGSFGAELKRIGESFVGGKKGMPFPNPQDLKDLGIRRLYLPLFWEEIAPKDLDRCDWTETQSYLEELAQNDIEIMVGFLNHGSGPFYTSLIDPDFPEKFSIFARNFINRFPWVNHFLLINDMQLTAERSCLEGQYYPHLKDHLFYLKALLNQCKATILAQQEIRRVNPKASFILSESVEEHYSTEALNHERDFWNDKRWLAYDLILGKVNSSHPLHAYILSKGIREDELSWFQEHQQVPQTLGLNFHQERHRFFDHELSLYPQSVLKTNSHETYANLNAMEVGSIQVATIEETMKDMWNRYQTPLAVIESSPLFSMGRENEMRWLQQIWDKALSLKEMGLPIDAITSAMATTKTNSFLRSLTNPSLPRPAVIQSEGIWETPRRMKWRIPEKEFSKLYHRSQTRPILITGGETIWGEALAKACGERNIAYRILKKREMDLTDRDSVEHALDVYKPWAVINAAGSLLIDGAESSSPRHASWVKPLVRAARDRRIALLHFSTTDSFLSHFIAPINVYKSAKAENETEVMSLYQDSLIIRTHSYGTFVSPTRVPDFVNECLNLLIDGEKGIVHLAPEGKNFIPQKIAWTKNSLKDEILSRLPGIDKVLTGYLQLEMNP